MCSETLLIIPFLLEFLQDTWCLHSKLTDAFTQLTGELTCWTIWSSQPIIMMILKVSQGSSLPHEHCPVRELGPETRF